MAKEQVVEEVKEEGLTLEKFEEASEEVKKVTQETKLVYSEYFSAATGNKVYFKPENMQYTGAYKVRGAYRGRKTAGTDHCVSRKPCPGRSLRGKAGWHSGYHRDADHDSAHEGEPHQKLWSGGCTVRRCIRRGL